MTRSSALAIAGMVLFGTPACVSKARMKAQQTEIDQLKSSLASIQREQHDLKSQNDSLRNQVFILNDRVETARTALSRVAQPPPKLEVVKLSPSASNDVLAARVGTAPSAPKTVRTPDPMDSEGYDSQADEAEMFSYADETGTASVSPIPEMGANAARATGPKTRPVTIASASPTVVAPIETMPAPLARTKTTGPKEDPMKLYQRAFAAFQEKKWEEAQLLFQQFVNENPAHEYADNAYYWMGEIYYTQQEYALAIPEFQKVPELYPGGNKVPDALLKLGLCYQGLNNPKNAEKTLRQLVDAYPQSNAAQIGRQKLVALSKQ